MSAVIVGGGLAGLSSAFYLRTLLPTKLASITVLEQSSRLGGWISTNSLDYDNEMLRLEQGPRTIRPKSDNQHLLNMVSKVGLSKDVISVSKSHVSARNRLIKVDNQLYALPNSLKQVVLTQKPFERPLVFALAKDLFTAGKRMDADFDEDLLTFVRRRFGDDVADLMVDPLVRGVCAGDANKISADAFVLGPIFDLERRHGSVVIGAIKDALNNKFGNKINYNFNSNKLDKKCNDMSECNELVKRSEEEKWSVWSLQGGLESLINRLSSTLAEEMDVDIRLNAAVRSVKTKPNNQIEVQYEDKHGLKSISDVDQVFLALPSRQLCNLDLGQELNSKLRPLLNSIPYVSLAVVNVVYHFSKNIELPKAFGYLVPSSQPGAVLGVIFDSVTFDLSHTVLTVMIADADVEDIGKMRNVALEELRNTLNITVDPDQVFVNVQRNCIAQYTVGHRARVRAIRDALENSKLSVVGSSYDGVGLNDVAASAFDQVMRSRQNN